MTQNQENETVRIELSGSIASNNAQSVEDTIRASLNGKDGAPVILDAEKLEYISSAGLRIILRLKNRQSDIRIVNVSPDVYGILEMTGFTQLMPVEKAYRVVSVDGCEIIGEGFNGTVYRTAEDTVVKVYKNNDALAEIQREREIARLALVLGVPTAISYDVVRVGDGYGSVFELLDARSFSRILTEEPERMDWCVGEYVKMLKTIHAIEVPAGKLPSIREKTLSGIRRIRGVLPDGAGETLVRLVEAVPESGRMVHGDCHTKNIVLAGDEVLLIDMDTLSVGDPVFELARMYNAYVGFSEYDHEIVHAFQGFSWETSCAFWDRTLSAYLGTSDPAKLAAAEDRIRVISYAMLIDWKTRHSALVTAPDRETRALWIRELTELLGRVDALALGTDRGGEGERDA